MTRQRQADGKWVNYSYDWMFKPGAMTQIAQYADGIGPDYHMLVAANARPGRVALNEMGERGASPASGGAPVYRPR